MIWNDLWDTFLREKSQGGKCIVCFSLWFIENCWKVSAEGTYLLPLWSGLGELDSGWAGRRLSFHCTLFFIIWVLYHVHILLNMLCMFFKIIYMFRFFSVRIFVCVFSEDPWSQTFYWMPVLLRWLYLAEHNKKKTPSPNKLQLNGFISSHYEECGGRHSRPCGRSGNRVVRSLCSALSTEWIWKWSKRD